MPISNSIAVSLLLCYLFTAPHRHLKPIRVPDTTPTLRHPTKDRLGDLYSDTSSPGLCELHTGNIDGVRRDREEDIVRPAWLLFYITAATAVFTILDRGFLVTRILSELTSLLVLAASGIRFVRCLSF